MEQFVIGKKYRVLDNEAARHYFLDNYIGEEFTVDAIARCPTSGSVDARTDLGEFGMFVPPEAAEEITTEEAV